ncbi:hypothetical protein KSS87_014060, partial [Heliosperma pusillum]
MLLLDLSFSTALNPCFSNPKWRHCKKTLNPRPTPLTLTYFHKPLKSLSVQNTTHSFPCPKPDSHRPLFQPPAAGRSKKTPSTGRILGSAELRSEAKRNARRKSRKLAESLFYRLKNPHRNHPDNFSEEELQMIGLGYDRTVRFMSKDDPNLKHPYDWYKYGEFGPYSWRGIVVGDPIRGRFSDECAHLTGTVKNHEDWDVIEQHDMTIDFGERLGSLSKDVGLQNFWVFVRHPKWKLNDLPWEQWTLVSEVVLEAGNQRLDKWSLMGRLGNKTRELITKCAAWMRPDIIYVKKPVFQCRFEPQANFFKPLLPYLCPATEGDLLFELQDDEGRVELCTYFGGLCKILKVSPKAYVDDVVKAYEKLSDEKKSKCLEFLLMNHPVQLLHPYTKEWKAKLEEMELGCDAPDDDDNNVAKDGIEFTDWVEDEGDGKNDDGEEDGYVSDADILMDSHEGDDEDEGDDESEPDEEDSNPEEDANYWKEQFQKSISSSDAMEKLVKRSMEKMNEHYEEQLKEMEEREMRGDEMERRKMMEKEMEKRERMEREMEKREMVGSDDDNDDDNDDDD